MCTFVFTIRASIFDIPTSFCVILAIVPFVVWVCFVDVGYESEEFNDNISKDLVDWGKLGFHYGHGGNWRIVILLFKQLDGKEMELKNTTPSSPPCMPLPCQISRSPFHLCLCHPCLPLCIPVTIPICKLDVEKWKISSSFPWHWWKNRGQNFNFLLAKFLDLFHSQT